MGFGDLKHRQKLAAMLEGNISSFTVTDSFLNRKLVQAYFDMPVLGKDSRVTVTKEGCTVAVRRKKGELTITWS